MPTISITVFMIRRSAYVEFNRFLSSLEFRVPVPLMDGNFYPLPDDASPPAWVVALSKIYVPISAMNELKSQSPAALLSCRVNRKWFVISFGHAWMKLSNDWIDHNFGRRVALNSIGDDDLRQLRSEQVLAKRHRSIERSPSSAKLSAFGYESDRDLVFSVEGISRIAPFVGNVRGGSALRFDVDIESIRKALFAASSRLGYGYQSKFPDIDNLLPVVAKEEIASLEDALAQEIESGNTNGRVTLTPPSSLEVFDQDIYFSYGRWRPSRHSRSWSLVYAEWVASLGSNPPTLAGSEVSKIHVVDAGTGHRKSSINAKEAISYDLVRGDGHYIIFSGRWYKASPDLNTKLSAFLASLSSTAYPPIAWNGMDDEGKYNSAACQADTRLLHMDVRHVFYGPGQSKFEFCDFLDPANKVIYFVKNPSSAQGMSHLYEQARRTTELFFGNNPEYRAKLRAAVVRHRPSIDTSWLDSPPRGPEWEVCLVSMGKSAEALPMFARCGLMRVYRDLAGRFSKVSYCVV